MYQGIVYTVLDMNSKVMFVTIIENKLYSISSIFCLSSLKWKKIQVYYCLALMLKIFFSECT